MNNSRNRGRQPPLVASPKYPWRSYSPLRTHDFIVAPSESPSHLRVFVCRKCDRRFKFNAGDHTTWAVARDANSSALQDAVNTRWLSEPCVGRREADEADGKLIKGRARAKSARGKTAVALAGRSSER
jgi:hypothetical protein